MFAVRWTKLEEVSTGKEKKKKKRKKKDQVGLSETEKGPLVYRRLSGTSHGTGYQCRYNFKFVKWTELVQYRVS